MIIIALVPDASVHEADGATVRRRTCCLWFHRRSRTRRLLLDLLRRPWVTRTVGSVR